MADKYYNENYKKLSIKFNKQTEADMIDELDKHQNVSGYIKGLIKTNMEENGNDQSRNGTRQD